MTGADEINTTTTFSSMDSSSDYSNGGARECGSRFVPQCSPPEHQQQLEQEEEEEEEEEGQQQLEQEEEDEEHAEEDEGEEEEQQPEQEQEQEKREGVRETRAVEDCHYSSSSCGERGAARRNKPPAPAALPTLQALPVLPPLPAPPVPQALPALAGLAEPAGLAGTADLLEIAAAPSEDLREPLFCFGAIADVQYSDREDGWNFTKTHRRYYRGGLVQLRRAVDSWLRDGNIRFTLQLGDVIDGCNRHGQSEQALRNVKRELDRLAEGLPLGVLNSLGNHELYNFSKRHWAREIDCSSRAKAVALAPSPVAPRTRKTLLSDASPPPPPAVAGVVKEGLGGKKDGGEEEEDARDSTDSDSSSSSSGAIPKIAKERFYYSFCPHPLYRLISLDTYDVNAIRGEPGTRRREEEQEEEGEGGGGGEGVEEGEPERGAVDMLSEQNPNEDKNDSEGMEGLSSRFVQYNGGVGAEQLLWLEKELEEATAAGQRVIAFGHVPIHPIEAPSNCLLWNFKDVLEVMHQFDCVAMFLSGHRHQESYCRDSRGVHHVSLAAALEAPPDQEAFARIEVHADCLRLRGHGIVESRTMALV